MWNSPESEFHHLFYNSIVDIQTKIKSYYFSIIPNGSVVLRRTFNKPMQIKILFSYDKNIL